MQTHELKGQRGPRTLVGRTREDLARRIREGEFAPGQRLPSEAELARYYDVSRLTLREAIRGLQQERLLTIVHGRGIFIARSSISRPITRLQSVTEMAADLGYTLTTRVLDARVEPAAGRAALVLGVDEGVELLRLERVRLVDARPAIYSLDIFLARLAEDDRPPEAWQESLFLYLETRTGRHVTHATATLRAVLLDAAICARIDAPDGQPWLLLEQTNYVDIGEPLVYSLDYHDGDLFSFDVLRNRY